MDLTDLTDLAYGLIGTIRICNLRTQVTDSNGSIKGYSI